MHFVVGTCNYGHATLTLVVFCPLCPPPSPNSLYTVPMHVVCHSLTHSLTSVCLCVHWRLCSMFQDSASLPGSPFVRRNSRGSQFSWKKKPCGRAIDRQPLVYQTLESLPLPFADDSAAVTPSSEDLCNFPFHHKNAPNGRRYSFASQSRRHWPDSARPSSRRSSFASSASRNSRTSRYSVHSPLEKKESKMDTLFSFTRRGSQRVPDVVVDKPCLDRDDVSAQSCPVFKLKRRSRIHTCVTEKIPLKCYGQRCIVQCIL